MFSDNLKTLQNKRKVSNYRIAKEVGVSASTVSNWRLGAIPNASRIKKLAEYFKVSIDELMR